MDHLIRLLVEVGGAAVAAWVANKVVKEMTGRSIPQHLSSWWDSVNYDVSEWIKNHQHLKVTKVVVVVFTLIDRFMVAANKSVTLSFKAQTTSARQEKITERTLPASDALKLFPELANQTEVPIQLTH